MPARPLLRDLTLLAAAAAIGWWAHGANTAVQAQHNSSSDTRESSLGFAYSGLGPDGQLTLYNSSNHTLYVYPSVGRSGSSHINCLYSVHVDAAGAPLERTNCPR
jgi:hypothetical protein